MTPRWARTLAAMALVLAVATTGACTASLDPAPTSTTTASSRAYPVHTDIVATTFWIGETFDPDLPDGSQTCSTYDSQWAHHYSGVNTGRVPTTAPGCPGSITGGCDGSIDSAVTMCRTEARTAGNDFFPRTGPKPQENPFYLDLPYDDLNDPIGFDRRCETIPWADDPGYRGHCTDPAFSYMKNRWVKITGESGRVCFGQIEDAGPSHDDLYHDGAYVFGHDDARPRQRHFNNAGLDVSPALNGCLDFRELDGESDRVSWQFVEVADVPRGPWSIVVTTSGVTS